MNRVVLLFLDGVGIGPDDPECNPFLCTRLPALTGLLGAVPEPRALLLAALVIAVPTGAAAQSE